ncbi:hypothetical protein KIN20_002294 [Parelaphostrongylus tenuis]|uniref:Uncharacterized protein n=1 Tax=Parelaphostrongylus tenuis TaxID=148309 RepID=A0AAD5LY95_PARTN|nr:hypothetical protein KIN20_002294 [Parelaphostrongylus tenuis]
MVQVTRAAPSCHRTSTVSSIAGHHPYGRLTSPGPPHLKELPKFFIRQNSIENAGTRERRMVSWNDPRRRCKVNVTSEW